MHIAFLHPDLGIGGAERLVIDAAVEMQRRGHDVVVFTSYHDKGHCFEETRDGTLKVVVLGNHPVPRNILGRLSLPCAIARQVHLVLQLWQKKLDFDVFVVDQLSAAVPLLRILLPSARTLFYCHYPDLLLSNHVGLLRKAYRLPLDWFERWSTAQSDIVAVNSKYTRQVFKDTFGTSIPEPAVIYPAVELTEDEGGDNKHSGSSMLRREIQKYPNPILLSVNRFERKKNIELALQSYALLLHANLESRDSMLIIAGGYDERVRENAEYLVELRDLARRFRLPSATLFPGDRFRLDHKVRVLFLPSVPSDTRNLLLSQARALLYTPTNEHFGIVPLESMRSGTPVLATNTGGPLETVVDGETGWLREPDVNVWFEALAHILLDQTEEERSLMAKKSKERAKLFSVAQLGEQLESAVLEAAAVQRSPHDSRRVRREAVAVTISALLLAVSLALVFYYIVTFLLWAIPAFVESMSWPMP